jgi:hypothetical protein
MPDKRLLDDWLASYLEYTSNHEAPESIHQWTALAIVAAALRRRVYIEHEYYKIFPNIYVIIVAESAKVRKSTAMDIGRDLLLDAIPDIKIMRDSMTSVGLIKALNRKTQVIKDDKITEELKSDVVIFADEVANLFSYERTRASQMVIFLTTAYSSKDVHDHTTARDSTIRLYNLYPVLLGGTDPKNLKVIPEDAVGGLTGRLMWIIESERRINNPGWKKSDTNSIRRTALREFLIHDLQRISRMQGELTVSVQAQELYNNWYNELSKRNTRDPETDAFYHRCHTTALKTATLVWATQTEEMIMSVDQMKAGITLVESRLPAAKRVTMWSGGSQYEQNRAKFVTFLTNSGGVSTRRILLKHMGMMGEDFEKLKSTLIQDGTITVPSIRLRNEEVIKLMPTGGQSKPESTVQGG